MSKRLERDLVCLCGRCDRDLLAECPCNNAVIERRSIRDLLAQKDLSTPEKQEIAYREVLDEYVERYGREVLASEDAPRRGPSRAPVRAIAIGVMVTAAAGVLFWAWLAGRRKRVSPRRSPRRPRGRRRT